MFNKSTLSIVFLILLLFQNSYADNIKQKNKVEFNIANKFFHPLRNNKNIIKIEPKYEKKAGYLGFRSIYVKEDIHNLGEYEWNHKKRVYINIINNEDLLLKKGKIYLISQNKYDNIKFFNDFLKKINKKNLSRRELKKIFKFYSKKTINHTQLRFYSKLVDDLVRHRLLYFKNKEYLFLVDKHKESGYIFAFHKKNKYLEYIGGDKVSTGNPGLNSRNDRYFDTPIGIINRKRYRRGDWRSVAKDSLSYGQKGNRIYYLGKYMIPIKYNSSTKKEVHLAIHSTTPIDDMLLGNKASKGCIRISAELNKILNKSAIIDGTNGKYVIIVDSGLSIKENLKRLKKFSREKLKTKRARRKYAQL